MLPHCAGIDSCCCTWCTTDLLQTRRPEPKDIPGSTVASTARVQAFRHTDFTEGAALRDMRIHGGKKPVEFVEFVALLPVLATRVSAMLSIAVPSDMGQVSGDAAVADVVQRLIRCGNQKVSGCVDGTDHARNLSHAKQCIALSHLFVVLRCAMVLVRWCVVVSHCWSVLHAKPTPHPHMHFDTTTMIHASHGESHPLHATRCSKLRPLSATLAPCKSLCTSPPPRPPRLPRKPVTHRACPLWAEAHL